MGTMSLARKRDEPFCVVEEPNPRLSYVADRAATDEEAHAAFSYAISKHKKALEELARYDSCH